MTAVALRGRLSAAGRGAVLSAVLSGVVLAGCADAADVGAGSVAAEVRPFEEVQASDLTFEADPLDPTRGIFRVTTTEPMICAIVWGETEALGRFNNSLAMSGTGIEQHDVVLPDLQQGAEYRFVVQGTTADGTLYRSSEIGTFTIRETRTTSSSTQDRGENLATDAEVVRASSTFGAGFEPERAIDGDLATEWSTAGDGDDASIVIDLGAETEVGGVAFLTRSMADGSAITEEYTVAVDGGAAQGPFPAGSPADPTVADVDLVGRELSFDVTTSTGGNVGAVEIQVYAK